MDSTVSTDNVSQSAPSVNSSIRKNSGNDIKTLRSIGRKRINSFTSEDIQKSQKCAYKFYKELGTKSPFFRAWFGDWRAEAKTKIPYISVNTNFVNITDISRGDFYNEDTKWNISFVGDGIDETSNKRGKSSQEYRALKDINNMLENAILLDTVIADKPSKRMVSSAIFVHHLYCPINIGDKKGIAKLYVSEHIGGEHKFYLTKIEEISTAKVSTSHGSIDPRVKDTTGEISSEVSVYDVFDIVKKNDMNFEMNSKNPVYYNPKSVNPLLLNEDGTPKVFYHGTSVLTSAYGKNYGNYINTAKNEERILYVNKKVIRDKTPLGYNSPTT